MIKSILTTNKKAQAWGFDLTVASIIFVIGIISIYVYTLNFTKEAEENFDLLFYEGKIISSELLSEGSPPDWTVENVGTPGLTTKNRINQTKLGNLYNLSQTDYQRLKKLLNTRYDFYFFFSNNTISENIEGVGKPGLNSTAIPLDNHQNLVKITRFTIYKNKPVTMNLYIWK